MSLERTALAGASLVVASASMSETCRRCCGCTVTFASGGLIPEIVTVDVKQPSPPPQQPIQQLQQFDQQQAIEHVPFQARQAQMSDGTSMC